MDQPAARLEHRGERAGPAREHHRLVGARPQADAVAAPGQARPRQAAAVVLDQRHAGAVDRVDAADQEQRPGAGPRRAGPQRQERRGPAERAGQRRATRQQTGRCPCAQSPSSALKPDGQTQRRRQPLDQQPAHGAQLVQQPLDLRPCRRVARPRRCSGSLIAAHGRPRAPAAGRAARRRTPTARRWRWMLGGEAAGRRVDALDRVQRGADQRQRQAAAPGPRPLAARRGEVGAERPLQVELDHRVQRRAHAGEHGLRRPRRPAVASRREVGGHPLRQLRLEAGDGEPEPAGEGGWSARVAVEQLLERREALQAGAAAREADRRSPAPGRWSLQRRRELAARGAVLVGPEVDPRRRLRHRRRPGARRLQPPPRRAALATKAGRTAARQSPAQSGAVAASACAAVVVVGVERSQHLAAQTCRRSRPGRANGRLRRARARRSQDEYGRRAARGIS